MIETLSKKIIGKKRFGKKVIEKQGVTIHDDFLMVRHVKKFIKKIEKIAIDAQQYADMDEPEFWATSTISPTEAQNRADHFFEFLEEIKKEAGKELI